MKIEKLILYIVLILSIYNIIVKNDNNHFSLKTDIIQNNISTQCSIQIQYDSVPCFSVKIYHRK